MAILNLGIVGCGDIAGYTALISKLVSQVRLSACCDVNTERVNTFAKRHRIHQTYTDYAEMLGKADLDAVYLAIPHDLHYDMILSAVDVGKPVFVEKPLTRTLSEGIKLVETVTNQKVGVNYQYRYDSGCYALGRAVQVGALGHIHSIRINIPWHRTQSYFDGAPWHKTITQAGGGTLITQGSHFLDVALWALGEQPVSAMGYTSSPGFDLEVDTLAHGIVETEGGTLINITSSMVAASEQSVTIEVYGERGTALYRDLPLPRVKFIGVKVRKERPPDLGLHALQRSLAGFAKWVLNDKPYLTPARETLPVLATVDGIYRSAKTGKRECIEI
ncbi:MAG: Gfo/Idh/MocA family oxidoreductase [Anaerolineales bacterium]|jgi:predicted dehydrogenase